MVETLRRAGVPLGYPGGTGTWHETSDGSFGLCKSPERNPDCRPEGSARRQAHLVGTWTRLAAVQLENVLDVGEQTYLTGTANDYAGRRQWPPVTPVSFAQDSRPVETARIKTENGR